MRGYGRNGARANAQHYGFDEAKFLPKQRETAVELVEYEFADKADRKTKEQIAKDVDIARMTLHNWEKKDANFIAYKNYLAAQFFDSYLPFVYRKMLDGISHGSMKGIELFLKRYGDLDSRSEIMLHDGTDGDKTHEERKKELMERLKRDELSGEDVKDVGEGNE